jgi:hypothetical protein
VLRCCFILGMPRFSGQNAGLPLFSTVANTNRKKVAKWPFLGASCRQWPRVRHPVSQVVGQTMS